MKQMLNTLNIYKLYITICNTCIYYRTLYIVVSLKLNTLQGDFF